jgi:hypothetical protein
MTKEKYEDIKDDYVQHIIDYVENHGGLFPHISVFADVINPKDDEHKDKPALIHIPIDDDFMKDEESKDKFVDEILPDVFKTLKEKFIPQGIAWAAEAWMRIADKSFDPDKQDYKKLPIKKEVIMINIESKNTNDCFIYEIQREGKQVNADGSLVDTVKLLKLDNMSGNMPVGGGRFTGLFNKFNK